MNTSLLPESGRGQTAWRALGYFSAYRFLIAFLFTALVWITDLPKPFGTFQPELFRVVTHAYLLAAVLLFVPLQARMPRFPYQVAGQVCVDIAAITLIMYASGGISSGFGILLIIVVAGGSLLKPGRIAYFFAATATLAVLGEEVYATLQGLFPVSNYTYTQAGLLGVAYFFTAFVGHMLARRVRESEALAEQRALDLRQLARLNEHIVQHMQSGVMVLDADRRIRLINTSARQLLGLANDVTGRIINTISPLLATALDQWHKQTDTTPQVFRPESGEVDVQLTGRELNPGSDTGQLVFLEDASLLRQRAQHLKLASLGRMAASIAHEVRNPLGAISHASQLLTESDSLSQDDQHLTRIIQNHSLRVNAIIENVMRISRREPAVPRAINIRPWLEEFVADFTEQNRLQANAVRINVAPAEIEINTDTSQLQQVLWNLCDNAIRYSRGAVPWLELDCGIRPDIGRPYLDIIDHGTGMPEETARHVFEPFVTSESQGTGLGLYIARELCEANQAALTLYSNSDEGCCFRITFPHPAKHQAVE